MKNKVAKKSLSILLALIMVLSALPLTAVMSFAETSGDYEYSVLNDGTAEITKYNGSAKDLIIPSTIDGYSVTSIGENAFSSRTSLTSVTIPDGVTNIGDAAFYYCTSLTSITIPGSVTSIGSNTFYYCTSLTSITIPDSVTNIGDAAFLNCTSLTSITIPDSVTSIGDSAFRFCTSLTSITIPDSVTSIGEAAFFSCTSLTGITIPNSVTSIGSNAFDGCTSLTSITIPDSVTSIGGGAFWHCTSLTSITIPDSVTSIGGFTFSNCTSLTSIIIPDSVTSIGGFAFRNCTSLTSITIPGSVTVIEPFAFGYIWNSDTFDYELMDGFTICGYTGSAAETYAKENNIKFVALDAPAPISFPDVSESAWYYDAAQYNAQKGFITGYSNGNFGGGDQLKRQDFVVILARIAGADLEPYENVQSKMPDVKQGSYYASAVNWAVDNHIINGYNNGKFGVGDPITREQVATILYRYMGAPKVTGADATLKPFADANRISDFAKDAVVWAIQNGVISGKNATTLAPTATASRAEIATIIMRMDQKGMFST